MPFIIHRKPAYRLYIEEGAGGAMAHVAELPGCFAAGSDAAKATGHAPRAITEFLQWLRSHREPIVPEAFVSRPAVADLYVAEVRASGAPTVAGSYAALFEFDQVPWDNEKLERTLRWLAYSREDLLAEIEDLSEAEMKGREVAPRRSLWDTLRHVADAEYGYANRIAGPLEGKYPVSDDAPSDVRVRLGLVRSILVEAARSTPAGQRVQVVHAPWARRPDEPWTLQKALRRALEHEREHTAELGDP